MGIFGGYLAGARAAREDKLKERQQDEAERRARADEALRRSEADRTFRKEESAADRDLRQQAIDQGTYQFERTQANADARLGLELDKGRVETGILEAQRDELRRKREERTKERELIGKSNMMGLGLVFDNLLSTPVGKNGIREMDSGDLAEIVKMYPQFANIEGRGSLMGGACVVNPETGRAEIKLMYGDGKNVTSQSSFDELGIMRGLRAAGYGEDSVNSQLNLIRPEPTVMKLKKMTTQEQMKQTEIRETERLGDERRHKNKMEQIKFKQALESVDTEIHNAEMLIAEAERNRRDGWEKVVADQRAKIEAAQKKKDALLANGGEDATSAPTADPLATKYGKYLAK